MPKAVNNGDGWSNDSAYSNNQGAAPTLPVSGVPVNNGLGRPMVVTVSGGTLTGVTVGGNPAGTSGRYVVPDNQAIVLVYTGSPSWTWTDGSNS